MVVCLVEGAVCGNSVTEPKSSFAGVPGHIPLCEVDCWTCFKIEVGGSFVGFGVWVGGSLLESGWANTSTTFDTK